MTARVGQILNFEDLVNQEDRVALINELFRHVMALGNQDSYEPYHPKQTPMKIINLRPKLQKLKEQRLLKGAA